jgi:hypothetical protein
MMMIEIKSDETMMMTEIEGIAVIVTTTVTVVAVMTTETATMIAIAVEVTETETLVTVIGKRAIEMTGIAVVVTMIKIRLVAMIAIEILTDADEMTTAIAITTGVVEMMIEIGIKKGDVATMAVMRMIGIKDEATEVRNQRKSSRRLNLRAWISLALMLLLQHQRRLQCQLPKGGGEPSSLLQLLPHLTRVGELLSLHQLLRHSNQICLAVLHSSRQLLQRPCNRWAASNRLPHSFSNRCKQWDIRQRLKCRCSLQLGN